jgi:dTDP-4-amino-4,6-dideoxygalactose transaminase
MSMDVPFVDLKAQFRSIRQEVEAAIGEVLESARYVGGPQVEAFEEEFARYCGAQFAVGVGNGTEALRLALAACGVGAGSEVITAANTFTATAEAIVQVGARPVFVDVDETYTLDVGQVAAALTPRTRAIIPVHLYGQPADMDPLMELAERHGVALIEDAAQAHGARYRGRRVGGLGHMACFSFYPAKNLGAYGDGGAVVTNDGAWASRVRLLADHGRSGYYTHSEVGFNSRLDALQAVVLRVKLRHLDAWNEARRRVADLYKESLGASGLVLPVTAPGREHVYHLYVVRCPVGSADERDRLRRDLEGAGVHTGLHYPLPLHLQPAYTFLGYGRGAFPRCEAWADQLLSLPMYAELTGDQVSHVAEALLCALGQLGC